ncbi:glycoside hydrolase family 104 protein [Cyanobium sp. Cruz CV13-4-11]|uniref:glycoside hydrolase family 24 protein n=1 Tax=unclassified Cyanobium TaxID=2627006 RepID=UPI0037BFDC7E
MMLLPMVQRPVAPLPPAAPVVAMPTAQPAVAVTGRRPGGGPYGITPERRALLNTIRFAEGTWIGGSQEGYQVLYGGDRFDDLSRHPDIVVRRRYASAAAGAYQFLPTTWDQAASELQLRDFRPASQDQAALHLVHERGALQRFDRHGLTAEVLARLAPEWASLPTLDGGSHYGQPVKDRSELQRFYQRELERLRRLASA